MRTLPGWPSGRVTWRKVPSAAWASVVIAD